MTQSTKWLASAVIALLAVAGPALAHHSASMFDEAKVTNVAGTVKEFQFTQPHCWLVVTVPGENGAAAVEWRIEAGAPTLLQRVGIQKSTFPVGAPVTVTFHPLRDGRPAGLFMKATLASGKEVGLDGGAPPPAAAPGP
jgi:hypothetical protein